MSDDTLASRVASRVASQLLEMKVAARFAYTVREADEGGEDQPPNAKGGVPPRWKEWLDATKGGGKRKVPNPNPDTSQSHPQVSFTTALKDPATFTKAMKEYHEWSKKNPEPKRVGPHEPRKQEEETKSKPAPSEKPKKAPKPAEKEPKEKTKPADKEPTPKVNDSFTPSGELDVSDHELDKIIQKHLKDFEAATEDMRGEIASYSKKYGQKEFRGEKVPDFAIDEYHALSEQEKMILISGHWIGELFEKSLSPEDKEIHEIFTKQWTSSSSNATSSQVQGALGTLGVSGHQTSRDKDNEMYREAGAKKDYLKKYLGQAYAFSQAYFRHLGVTEVTLFRGVMDKSVNDADEGEDVSIETRELSSFTSDPKVAARFGRPLKMKVPVKAILWSNLNATEFSGQVPPGIGEAEVAVMGASDIPGKTIGKAGKAFDIEGR